MRRLWQRLIDLPRHLSKKEKVILGILLVLFLGYGGFKGRNFIYHRLILAPTYGGRVIEGVVGQPKLLSPLAASEPTDKEVLAVIYPGLTRTTADGRTFPVLAESWDISEDGLTYTFTLRQNLKWHDGVALTTSDVAESINRVLDEETHSPYYDNWYGVTAEVVSDRVIKFHLTAQSAPFLAATNLPIVPVHIAATELQQSLTGSGPYKYSKSTTENNSISTIELTSNPDWYAGKPYIDNLVFRFFNDNDSAQAAFRKGDIDSLVDDSTDTFKQKIFSLATQQLRMLFLNTQRDPLKNIATRSALLGTGTLPAGLNLTLVTHNNLANHPALLAAIDSWKSQGATINLVALDTTALLDRLDTHDYDLLFVNVDMSADMDRFPFWHSSQIDGGLNFSQINDPNIDKQLEKARTIKDIKERERLTNDIQQQIDKLAIEKSLEQVKIQWHLNSRIQGVPNLTYVVSSPDRFANIEQWYVKTKLRSWRNK